MDIYIVKARAISGKYHESVELLEGLEEKPKSYVGSGKRIDKRKIGNVEEGMFYGSFQVHITKKEDIPFARMMVRNKVGEYVQREFDIAKENLDAFTSYDIKTEVEIKNARN